MQVVWFKRDLRIKDHAPLAEAAKHGRCVCLYVYEPEVMGSDEFDETHLTFLNQSLRDLASQLETIGGKLTLCIGDVPQVLSELHQVEPIEGLWSHQETGNRITYDRDQRVETWARDHHVPWRQLRQNGVVRKLRNRDGWSRQRDQFMNQPLVAAPPSLDHPSGVSPGELASAKSLSLPPEPVSSLQPGGTSHAEFWLNTFLAERGEPYSSQMSSPVTAPSACSRLSPYLAFGCISLRQVTHALQDRQQALRSRRASGGSTGSWLKSLRAFESRLSWRCHFMQKLEDEPEIEFSNMCRAYDGLREDAFNERYFRAWSVGQTGYPLVDACMRSLYQKRWINFRMRAMLVSFASYHLWLHWRTTGVFLGKLFLDFEPGIHYSQFQMQSGTTGINAVRIYSPIKQVQDQDPEGTFIREFVPELREVPLEYLAEPHKMPRSVQERVGCLIGKHYPAPIVEHGPAYRSAKQRIYAVRSSEGARQDARQVVAKHGSRKRRARG